MSLSHAIDVLVMKDRTELLKKIAVDFNLDFVDLETNYLTSTKPITIKSVKVHTTGKQCCTALTSKKDPCKFYAIKGSMFCKRHGEKPAPPAKTEVTVPMHTHDIGVKAPTGECALCESHGDPCAPEDDELEVVAEEEYEEDSD